MVVTSCRYLLASLLVSSATALCTLPAMRSSSPVFAAPAPRCLRQTSQTIHMSAAAAMPSHELSAPSTSKLGRILTGSRFLFAAIFSVVSLYPPLLCSVAYGYLSDNSRRRACDWIVQIWARATLFMLGSSVTVEGLENLPAPEETVLYVPNHSSFLDIFALSGYLPRRFKYISKIEILRIPLIGWAMRFARHIAIRRTDRASQLATFKEAVACLQEGSSLVAFPEGTRSRDGRLMGFKKGPFTMAARAKVRVVPLSIIGTHLFQPPGAFVPIASPRGVRIVVHPALDAPANKQEAVTLEAARVAVLSALPNSMQPLEGDIARRA